MIEHPTGLYEVTNGDGVFIRKEPKIVEGVRHNRDGKLRLGTRTRIYSVVTDGENNTWGRVSEVDAAGVARWICLQGLNRTYAKCIKPDHIDSPDMTLLKEIIEIRKEMEETNRRLTTLENIAGIGDK